MKHSARRPAFTALIVALGLAAAPVAAETRLGAGVYQFEWREFADSGERVLRERGPLYGVNWTYQGDESADSPWATAVVVRAFTGEVDYEAETTEVAPGDRSRYIGGGFEARASARFGGRISNPALEFGIGQDLWLRDFAPGTEQGYSAVYKVAYARLGLRTGSLVERGWRFDFGARYPFEISETIENRDVEYAGLIHRDCEILLEPEPLVSGYARIALRMTARTALEFHYDSYRFDASLYQPAECAGQEVGSYLQRPSELDLFGLFISHRF